MPGAKGEPFLRVRNWERFQHYKDRNPPWIKFHASTLDNRPFENLPGHTKGQIMLIWLLASRTENMIAIDRGWIAKKIGAAEFVDLELMIEKGYLEVCNGEGTPLSGAARDKTLAAALAGC